MKKLTALLKRYDADYFGQSLTAVARLGSQRRYRAGTVRSLFRRFRIAG